MRELHLHFLPILVAAVAKMALGSVWYSNALFFQPWIRMSGNSEQQVRQGLSKALAVDYIGSVLMALALAHVIHWGEAEPNNVVVGLFAAFLCWLGFVAVTSINIVTYEHKPLKLYLLNNGYQLVSMLIMGVILAVWG
jgi:hypothetical protein